MYRRPPAFRHWAFALVLAAGGSPALAAELTVRASGTDLTTGEVGCALHARPDGFPMGQEGVRTLWVKPENGRATCTFKNVAPGTYAVAVSHDLNGNRKTDVSLLGIPTEAWGVSGNVRPTLRAPRFAEAAFSLADTRLSLEIEVAR